MPGVTHRHRRGVARVRSGVEWRLATVVVLLLAVCVAAAWAARGGGRADLVVSAIELEGTVAPGESVVIATTTRNKARRKAGRSVTTLFLSKDKRRSSDDRALGKRRVKKLKKRKRSIGRTRVTLPATIAPGTWYVLACADSRKRVKERKEGNNCRASDAITIRADAPAGPGTPGPALPPPPPPADGGTGGGGGGAPGPGTPPPTEPPVKEPPGTNDPVPPPPPDPADVAPRIDTDTPTSLPDQVGFLYKGADPIQKGVADGTIAPVRVAVLRGRVLDAAGRGLPSVRVTIVDHPEFGHTVTRADGRFDIAVNGGQTLTVDYERPAFMSVQRHVDVPWQDYVDVEDVVMSRYASEVTTIDPDSTAEIQVAHGGEESDADGSRQATLMFERGTDAVMELPNGDTKPVEDLEVRATEYTVGENGDEAMPGELPATSAYTYAVEFSVDEAIEAGATDVRFDKPVISYVDNFLGFDPGTIVPAAYYDEEKAAWVPSKNGLVIKVLSTAGGIASVDVDGDDAADGAAELARIGMDEAERRRLAAEYTAGAELWRVEVRHFTPWDYNWPYGCKADCDPPDEDPPPPPVCPDCEGAGSVIGFLNQTLGEEVPLTGTPYSLRYSSDRAAGYRHAYSLDIPLTGDSVGASLRRVDLQVSVAGQEFTRSFAAAPNQSYRFTWDGKDGYGRDVQGAQTATVRIGYVYPAVYLEPEEFEASFAQFGGRPLSADRTRREIVTWQEWQRPVGAVGVGAEALGGWTLDVHHTYDPQGRQLYLGDGTRLTTEALRSQIDTVAGLAYDWWSGDEPTEATSTELGHMRGVAAAADGSFYIAETNAGLVRKVTPDGDISTVAGGGNPADGIGDGLAATRARLVAPSDVRVTQDGAVFISDTGNGRVRRVGPDGVIRTVAGGGDPDRLGDDGPATEASLERPRGIAITEDGTLYIADTHNNRVRRVTPDGRITTAAGGGSPADGLGDGGRAVDAALDLPYDVAVDAAGALYIADGLHHRIRKVDPDGSITTVAGNGSSGSSGDNGQAVNAAIGQPQGLDVAGDGTLYITDRVHHEVRRVARDGTISTFAGGGERDSYYDWAGGDGGPPARAILSFPQDAAVAPDGAVYIADAGNGRIRRAASSLPGFSDADLTLPSDDGSELYLFNDSGRHLRTLDALTGAELHRFAYDTQGRLDSVTDGDGNVTSIERAADGRPTAIVAPGLQSTALTVDAAGNLTRIANPAGEATTLSYAAGGLLTTLTDPEGGAHRFGYDGAGRLVSDRSPDGEEQTLTRNETPDGPIVKVATRLGRETRYAYEQLPNGDARRSVRWPSGATRTLVFGEDGRLTTTDPDGTRTTLTLTGDPRWGMLAPFVDSQVVETPSGLRREMRGERDVTLADGSDPLSVTSMTDRRTFNGRTVTTTIDALGTDDSNPSGWRVTRRSSEGRERVTTLDARGRPIGHLVAPGTAPYTASYDDRGRLSEVERGSQSLTLAYDARHRLVSETDAAGAVTRYEYDLADRATQMRLPGGQPYGYAYDDDGNLISVTMPSGSIHALAPTAGGKQDGYDPPGAGAFDSVFDADGMLTSTTAPSGAIERHGYDAAGRLTRIAWGDVTDTFGYAADGATDRVETMTRKVTGRADEQTLSLDHDGFLLTDVRFAGPAAGALSYEYDDNFRPTSERIESGSATPITDAIAHDRDNLRTRDGRYTLGRTGPAGALTRISDTAASPAGALTVDMTYDDSIRPAARTHTVGGTQVYKVELTRDNQGRISRRVETVGGTATTFDYRYDRNGRLVEVKRGGAVVETYGYDVNGNRTTPTASYDAQDRLTNLGGTAYTFDADGFLTRRGTDSFRYSRSGDLLSATVGGQTTTYAYDAVGRRVARTHGGQTWQYLYGAIDDQFRVTAVRSPSGELTKLHYDDAGFLYALERGGTRFYVATDQAGSPRIVTDAAGAVVKQVVYNAYGRVVSDSAPAFDLPIGFAGGIGDPRTGLVRFGWRDYDPAAGRWTARDPILFEGSPTNLYEYVLGDPVSGRDPSGLGWFDWLTDAGNEHAADEMSDMAKDDPTRSQSEYKDTLEEFGGEESQEATWDLGEQVKDLWNKCTNALGGDDGSKPPKKNPKKPNPMKNPLKDFGGSAY